MKVLLNTTTAQSGGALQISTSFILQAIKQKDGIEWVFAVSRATAEELRNFSLVQPANFAVFDSPSTSIAARRELQAFEEHVQPDCVFTLSGPAYVRFRSFHVLGCANGWVTHPTWTAYRSLPPNAFLNTFARNVYRASWFTQADAWIAQTQRAKDGLVRRLRCPPDSVAVVLNTCDEIYRQEMLRRPFPSRGKVLNILCFAAPYRHKNLESLPEIAHALVYRHPQLEFRIVMTVPSHDIVFRRVMKRARQMNVERHFENRGPIPVAHGPTLYRSCDILLLPTLLETFSTTYPEAMAMGLPIVTTDLGFAHDVCAEAALYYPPCDAEGAAGRISELISDQQLWERQITRGQDVLQRLPSPLDRYEQTVRHLLSGYVCNSRP
jgi:glycosyltransferase involved in cell wall biosynthesis